MAFSIRRRPSKIAIIVGCVLFFLLICYTNKRDTWTISDTRYIQSEISISPVPAEEVSSKTSSSVSGNFGLDQKLKKKVKLIIETPPHPQDYHHNKPTTKNLSHSGEGKIHYKFQERESKLSKNDYSEAYNSIRRRPEQESSSIQIDSTSEFMISNHLEDKYHPVLAIDVNYEVLGEEKLTKSPDLILDTPGCKIPKLDPWDSTVRNFIELQSPYECPGPPLFMKSNPDGSISLNMTVVEKFYNSTRDQFRCEYQPIYRSHEDPGGIRELKIRKGESRLLRFDEPLNEDYVGVNCEIGNVSFEQYFPLVRLKEEIEEERNLTQPPSPQLNVILLGIDSVSKLNFLRHFNKTRKFLEEKLSAFDMNGYVKVGDNTFPNLVPLLTGNFVDHYWNDSLQDTMFFDDLDFIWKDYAKKSFRTFYAEDNPIQGTFQYIKRGFYDPPTDYYYRPLSLALEYSNLKNQSSRKGHCWNSQIECDIIYDYLKDFVKAMGPRPYFAFAMVSNITHDDLNMSGVADEPTVRLLEELLKMGALDNSFLVLFGDHGLRYGGILSTYIGKIEERMPVMYVYVPKWFLNQYPEIAKNLRTNQDRLVTLFDVHATMFHLLDLNKTLAERSTFSLGSSLLEEIMPERTCEQAHIYPFWCTCQFYQSIPHNHPEAMQSSLTILNDINSQLLPYAEICEVLKLDSIIDARKAGTDENTLKYLTHGFDTNNKMFAYIATAKPIADYMITLKTVPGGAVFEGTVRHNAEINSYRTLGISRISLYGSTSWCINNQKLKIYCYCKIQNPT